MLLKDRYYKILHATLGETEALFHIALVAECEIYKGHFPGNPVCPGVCNMEMVKECAMVLTGQRLFANSVTRCRMLAIASPATSPELDITIHISPSEKGFSVQARISGQGKIYMEYKGTMETDPHPAPGTPHLPHPPGQPD